MKRISICGRDEVIDEIRDAAWKRRTSVSKFLIGLFEAQICGQKVAFKVETNTEKDVPKKIEKAREVFSEIEKKAGVKPVTLFTGGYSKELQVGKK